MSTMIPSDETLSRSDLCRRWRCSKQTLIRREKEQVLKAFKIGNLVRYKLADVLATEHAAIRG